MPITINGSGTVTGLSAGGLPDGSITSDDIAAGAVTAAKLAAGAGGKILQVVSTTKTDGFTTTSASNVDVTGLSVTITPASASNKILVISRFSAGAQHWYTYPLFDLARGSTLISQPTFGTSVQASTGGISYGTDSTDSSYLIRTYAIDYLDSPATTSSLTYKIRARSVSAGYTISVNRHAASEAVGLTSSITVMEVAA